MSLQSKIFAVLVIAHSAIGAYAAGDSASVPKKTTLNDTWFYGGDPNAHYGIDTSITTLHRFTVAQGNGAEYNHLGNTGTAAYPLVYQPASSVGFNVGFHQFDAYKYYKDSIRYYQVMRPYTELSLGVGLKSEFYFQGRFANSHKRVFYYGVDFRRFNSTGIYQNQAVNDNTFVLYGIYHPKGGRIDVQSDLVYNSFRTQENGGTSDSVFQQNYFEKTLAPVRLLTAKTNHSEIDWYLKVGLNIGKKYQQRMNDTLVVRTVLPVFKTYYQFSIQSGEYQYTDPSPLTDSAYYGIFHASKDTYHLKIRALTISNRFGFDFDAKKLTSDSTVQNLNLLMGASLQIDYLHIVERRDTQSFGNTSVSGYLRSNPALNPRLLYGVAATYYVSGYNRNDLLLSGNVGIDLRKYGRIVAGARYMLHEPDWMMNHYEVDSFSWHNTFPKMSALSFGGSYEIQKLGISLSAYNHIVNNYTYFAAPDKPTYESGTMNVLVVSFANRLGFKGIHFDNDIWFEQVAGSSALRLPLVTTKTSIYYENRIFKKVMKVAIGVDMRYNTPFYANGYYAPTGQFYNQDAKQLRYFPMLDVFLNVKVKTVRVFLSGTNLSSLFVKQGGYFTAYIYPAADASFKFGLKWRFFE